MSTVEPEDSEWDIRTTCTSISIHPLELSDKIAYESIKTVKMKWIIEQAKSPIPRYQDLPPEAFGRLTGRSESSASFIVLTGMGVIGWLVVTSILFF